MGYRIELIGGDMYRTMKKDGKQEVEVTDGVKVRIGAGDVVLHVDEGILVAPKPGDHRVRIAVVVESPFIPLVRKVFDELKRNPQLYLQRFLRVFVYDPRVAQLHPHFVRYHTINAWIHQPALHPKSKLVSMITSNKLYSEGHCRRVAFAHKNKDKLDLFGRGFQEIKSKDDGLRDYMFSVAIENFQWHGYHTEKILDCFLTGTVPIYYGDPLIGEVFNLKGIILLGPNTPSPTPELYRKMLPAVQDNYQRAQHRQYREWYLKRLVEDYLPHLPELKPVAAIATDIA